MSTTQGLEGDPRYEAFMKNLQAKLQGRWTLIFKLGLFIVPLVFIMGLAFVKWQWLGLYEFLIVEDGPIETLTAIAYLGACIIALSIAIQLYRRGLLLFGKLYILLSIGFLFICLEEMSWGQRFFQVPTPELFRQYNYQKELNLHNFAGRYVLHGVYIIIGGYGTFAFLILPRIVSDRFKASVDLFAPFWFLTTYFLPVFLLYLYYDYLSGILVAQFGEQIGWGPSDRYFITGKDQEPMELILSMGFLLFVGINWWRLTLGRFPLTSRTRQAR